MPPSVCSGNEYPHWMEADVFTVTVSGLMPSIFVYGGNRSATLTLNYNQTYMNEIKAMKYGNHSDPALLTVAEGKLSVSM